VIKRTLRGIIHVIGGLGAGLAIMMIFVAWQLSKGPISLGFLSPYFEDMVNSSQNDVKLQLRDTILTWAGWEKNLDIRVIDVQVLSPDNILIGSVPEVSFSLSGSALLRGEIAPRTVEIFGPELKFQRSQDGNFDIGTVQAGGLGNTPAIGLIREFLDHPSADNPLRYLDRIEIISADVTLEDKALEKTWHAPATDVLLNKDSLGVNGRISLILVLDEKQTELELIGRYLSDEKRFDLTADLDKLSLVPFAPVLKELAPLKAFNMPLHGSVAISIPVDGGAESIRFDLNGGQGDLSLPAPFRKSVPIHSVSFKGSYTGDSQQTTIENLEVELGPNWMVNLPAPVNHNLPLRSFSMAGEFDGAKGTLKVSRFDGDLHGPSISMSGNASGLGLAGSVDVDIDSQISNVPINAIRRYWPKSIGSDAYKWISTHMSGGTLRLAKAKASLEITEKGDLKINKIDGDMKIGGVDVAYFPPMASARVRQADITFNEKAMDIVLTGMTSKGLKLEKGTVRLTGLDEYDQYAEVRLAIEGSLKSKLNYIEQKPLQLASKIAFDPATAGGQAKTDLYLKFILENNLTLDQIVVSARSKIDDVKLSNVFLSRDIHDSSLDLKIDNAGMTLTGDVNFDAIPAQLVWRENFGSGQAYQSRYDLSAVIKDVRDIEDLGLDMSTLTDEYVSGAIGASIRFTIFDEVDRRLEIGADITEASMVAPGFGWEKKVGSAGRAEIVIDLERDVVVDIPSFSVKASDLLVRGAIKYAADGTGLNRIELRRVSYGRTDIEGAVIPKNDGGWEAGFHGKSFDLTKVWQDLIAGNANRIGEQFEIPNITLATEVEKVWLTETEYLKDVSGTFDYNDDLWQTVLLTSTLGEDTIFDLRIAPGSDGNRRLSIDSNNAGDAFRFLDFYDNMRGGALKVSGVYDDSTEGEPLTGEITVKDFRIANAPALARLVSILSLTGLLEMLDGEGLAFSTMDAPFVLHDGTLKFSEARASGVSLGFTASGNVYTHADVLDIEGTVVPAYALNSALGNIPLLGDILTGGEKGGGVFAANYSMTGSVEEPDVQVNPLSALTPGFLRNVFGIFDTPGNKTIPPENTELKILTD
jgi:hypothetical protein